MIVHLHLRRYLGSLKHKQPFLFLSVFLSISLHLKFFLVVLKEEVLLCEGKRLGRFAREQLAVGPYLGSPTRAHTVMRKKRDRGKSERVRRRSRVLYLGSSARAVFRVFFLVLKLKYVSLRVLCFLLCVFVSLTSYVSGSTVILGSLSLSFMSFLPTPRQPFTASTLQQQ